MQSRSGGVPPRAWDSDSREVSGEPRPALRSPHVTKLDWDKEERERRAREHGREEAWRALSTGVANLRKVWRRAAHGSIWVIPDLHEGRMLVLLPEHVEEKLWRLVLTANGKVVADKEVRGSVKPLIGVLPFRRSGWELSVYLGADWLPYETFDDFWPVNLPD